MKCLTCPILFRQRCAAPRKKFCEYRHLADDNVQAPLKIIGIILMLNCLQLDSTLIDKQTLLHQYSFNNSPVMTLFTDKPFYFSVRCYYHIQCRSPLFDINFSLELLLIHWHVMTHVVVKVDKRFFFTTL